MKAEDWISVENKLPKPNMLVLMYWYDANIVSLGYCCGEDDWIDDNDESIASPSHWMPIIGAIAKEDKIADIKEFLTGVKKVFKNAILKLEVKDYNDTYIIDISPRAIYENTAYINLEEEFREAFEETNPSATIVFVSEGSLVRADENNLEYKIL